MGKSTTPFVIVLDLDQTLIATQEDMEKDVYDHYKSQDTNDRLYDIDITDSDGRWVTWGLKRPHLNKFIDFCFKYFAKVIVWTAGTYEYGHTIVDQIFTNQRPHLVWTRKDCEIIETGPSKGEYSKPISKLGLDPKKVVTLDDKIFTGIENPNNIFVCPGYYPNVGKGEEINVERIYRKDKDRFLLEFMDFMLKREVMNTSDLRNVELVL
jgi:TFIIF-interacting CTD phosphatase-like protein